MKLACLCLKQVLRQDFKGFWVFFYEINSTYNKLKHLKVKEKKEASTNLHNTNIELEMHWT